MEENFNTNPEEEVNLGQVNMSVSAICQTDKGEKYAFVSFTDGVRTAEGKIPDCKITKNDGFAMLEISQLEKYLQENLQDLKKMASGVNIFEAFMK